MESSELLLRLLAFYGAAVLGVVVFAFISELSVLRGKKQYYQTNGFFPSLWDRKTNDILIGCLSFVSFVNVLIIFELEHYLPLTEDGIQIVIACIFLCLGAGWTIKPLAVIVGRSLARIGYAVVKKKPLFERN